MMKVLRREWIVEVRFADGEAPDTIKPYTLIALRPYAATVEFYDPNGDGPARYQRIYLHGHRVNRNGLGTGVCAEWSGSERLPEWLLPVIEQAKAIIRD